MSRRQYAGRVPAAPDDPEPVLRLGGAPDAALPVNPPREYWRTATGLGNDQGGGATGGTDALLVGYLDSVLVPTTRYALGPYDAYPTTAGGELVVLDAGTGRERWRRTGYWERVLRGGLVVVYSPGAGRSAGRTAYDLGTGSPIPVPDGATAVRTVGRHVRYAWRDGWTCRAEVDGALLVTKGAVLAAVDRRTGAQRWEVGIDSTITGVLPVPGRIYLLTSGGDVLCLAG